MSEMKNCSEEVDYTAALVSRFLAHVFGSPGASATEVADLSGATVLKYLTNSYTNQKNIQPKIIPTYEPSS